ncbi:MULTISPECIES: hypothetical protein [unclassified Mesorhizobium]|uniref:hypothetical protein n=1 Tax=unclassified Mesorhizobium TaxID=325217 RepID=UPI001FE1BB7A|nr:MULTISPECIES: hypothetical protein [unclassified Mesorhizobium]
MIPKCPHADLFNVRGRAWLARQLVPYDERFAIERHVRELDRLAEDLAILDREIAQEMRVAEQAQKGYEHFVEVWRPRQRAPQSAKA